MKNVIFLLVFVYGFVSFGICQKQDVPDGKILLCKHNVEKPMLLSFL